MGEDHYWKSVDKLTPWVQYMLCQEALGGGREPAAVGLIPAYTKREHSLKGVASLQGLL